MNEVIEANWNVGGKTPKMAYSLNGLARHPLINKYSLIPSCDYTPFPRNWISHHEQVLCEYIKGLSLPHDEITEIVWDYKILRHFSNNGSRPNNESEKVDTK
ncbi:hypothetical protein ACFE04_015922 [Oxalis oulophora]